MILEVRFRPSLPAIGGLLGWMMLACSSPDTTQGRAVSGGSGGALGSQGGTASGGSAPKATGGAPSGGTSSGGTVATGGTLSTGGSSGPASGGASSGGSASAGSGGTTTPTGGAGSNGGGSGGSPAGAPGTGGVGQAGGGPMPTEKFSFFVTSITSMRELSGSQDGFGGDLRFGEATGLQGADKICRTIAERSMKNAGNKVWRAFLSTIAGGPNGGPVNAIDRIGEGPWYDRLGRVVAMAKADLLADRPTSADPAIRDDLPNEDGIPNHIDGAPDCTGNACPDNHDVLTGTGPDGKLYGDAPGFTCKDWTNKENVDPASFGTGSGGGGGGGGAAAPTGGRFGGFMKANGPWCGHSWPRMGSGLNWMSALAEGGCAPGINTDESKGIAGPMPGVFTVGTGGGYGAIYCFALTP